MKKIQKNYINLQQEVCYQMTFGRAMLKKLKYMREVNTHIVRKLRHNRNGKSICNWKKKNCCSKSMVRVWKSDMINGQTLDAWLGGHEKSI